MTDFDPRLTPARPDLAAVSLKGIVSAEKFVDARPHQIAVGAAALRKAPTIDAMLDTEALFGERFDVYEINDGWAWGQLARDKYVGWINAGELAGDVQTSTHIVSALRTYVFSAADLKSRPLACLSLNAELTVDSWSGDYAHLARGGWVFGGHIALSEAPRPRDYAGIAEMFLGAPYLWGGKQSLGLDCSGLVQAALHASGRQSPRDADMQEGALGARLTTPYDLSTLTRGDLVFWKGHVGIMIDDRTLLHANAHHMATATEPLAEAIARIEPVAGSITSIKRL